MFLDFCCEMAVLDNKILINVLLFLLQQMNVSFEQKYSDKNDYTNSQDSLDFTTANPKVMTYHRAKGL